MKKCTRCNKAYADLSSYCQVDGAPLMSVSDIEPGMVIAGKWEVLETIGEGGMGRVYKVKHTELFTQLRALKVIHRKFADDPKIFARFRKEAVVTHLMPKDTVVEVYDTGVTEDGRPFWVMELFNGKDLHAVLHPDRGEAAKPLPERRALQIAAKVGTALAAAHHIDVIHRDIKPSNILIGPVVDGHETVKVVDFGIAKVREAAPNFDTAMSSMPGFIGTPPYASPEQAAGAKGAELSKCTDIYSLGVVLYEMLTGLLPFNAETPEKFLWHHQHTIPISPRDLRPELNISEAAAAVVMKALEKQPGQRFESADQMLTEIQRVLNEEPDEVSEVQSLINRAETLQKQGRLLEVRSELAHAAELDPTNRETRKRLQAIRALVCESHPLQLPWAVTVTTVPKWVEALIDKPELANTAIEDPKVISWLKDIQERPDLAERVKTHKQRIGSFWGWFETSFADVLELPHLRAKLEDLMAETAGILAEAEKLTTLKKFEAAERRCQEVLRRDPGNSRAMARLRRIKAFTDEKSVWDEALSSGRVVDFESFLRAYPNGVYAAEAGRRLEQMAVARLLEHADDFCRQRKHREAVEAYSTILQKDPGNPRALAGIQRAHDIQEEEQAWQRLSASEDAPVLQAYLNEYPNGFYAAEAKLRLRKSSAERLLQEGAEHCQARNSAKALECFRAVLEVAPEDARAQKGIQQAERIQLEEDAWRQALVLGSPEAFTAYLKKFPEGAYTKRAAAALEEAAIARLLEEAEAHCRSRNHEAARLAFEAVLDKQPDHMKALQGLRRADRIRQEEAIQGSQLEVAKTKIADPARAAASAAGQASAADGAQFTDSANAVTDTSDSSESAADTPIPSPSFVFSTRNWVLVLVAVVIAALWWWGSIEARTNVLSGAITTAIGERKWDDAVSYIGQMKQMNNPFQGASLNARILEWEQQTAAGREFDSKAEPLRDSIATNLAAGKLSAAEGGIKMLLQLVDRNDQGAHGQMLRDEAQRHQQVITARRQYENQISAYRESIRRATRSRDWNAADQQILRWLAMSPGDPEALQLKSEVAAGRKTDQDVADLRRAVHADIASRSWSSARGNLTRLSSLDQAHSLGMEYEIKVLEDRINQGRTEDNRVADLRTRIPRSIASGAYADAIRDIAELERLRPGDSDARILRRNADALKAKQDHDAVKASFDSAVTAGNWPVAQERLNRLRDMPGADAGEIARLQSTLDNARQQAERQASQAVLQPVRSAMTARNWPTAEAELPKLRQRTDVPRAQIDQLAADIAKGKIEDSLIPGLKAVKLTKVGLRENPDDRLANKPYVTRFPRQRPSVRGGAPAANVHWETQISFLNPHPAAKFTLTVVWYYPEGTPPELLPRSGAKSERNSYEVEIQEAWAGASNWTTSPKTFAAPGNYRVEFFIGSTKLGETAFEVY